MKRTAVRSKQVIHADEVSFKSFSECVKCRVGFDGGKLAGCLVMMDRVKRKQTHITYPRH